MDKSRAEKSFVKIESIYTNKIKLTFRKKSVVGGTRYKCTNWPVLDKSALGA